MNYVNQSKLPLHIRWENAMQAAMILTGKQAAVLLDQHVFWSATVSPAHSDRRAASLGATLYTNNSRPPNAAAAPLTWSSTHPIRS